MNLNEIAMGRCERLLALAAEKWDAEPELSKRYVSLARKIAMRHRLHLGPKRFCKKCDSVFVPGKTLKVRTSKEKNAVLYICLSCNSASAFPFIKEKKERKEK